MRYFCVMNTYFRASILLFILTFMQVSLLGQSDDLRTEIDKIIRFDTEIDFKKTPGFIVSVIDNDRVFHYAFGNKIKGDHVQLTADDIFEIGSVTKVFTATLISTLVKEGKMSLEDPVNNYIPLDFQNPRLTKLTISDLIHHQSGFPKRPAFFGKKEKDLRSPYAHYTYADLLKYYRDYIPEKNSFVYSHTNYALLELIAEKVTGKSFDDAIREAIFLPLSMDNSFVDFPEKKQNLIAPGYDRSQKVTPPWIFSSFKASEGIKTTPTDLVQFVNGFLDKPALDSSLMGEQNAKSFNDRLGIQMGWHTIHMNDFDILTHTGKTSGHSAFVGLVRETNTAVIILANSWVGTDDLGLQILRMINYNWKRIKA